MRTPSTRVGLSSVHVIAGLDAVYGGPSNSVPRLCAAIARAGTETALLTVAGDGRAEPPGFISAFRSQRFTWDHANTPLLRGLRLSSGLVRALRTAAPTAEVIHSHGLWLMPNVHAGWAAERAERSLVVSPRGMLSATALNFSRWKKEAFWRLLQGPVVRRAACVHATSTEEYEDIRAIGLTNPVTIISNGVDLPQAPHTPAKAATNQRTVLSLGRIHPKKGLDRLLQAWALIEFRHPDWRLQILGPAELGHDSELRALAAALKLSRVSIEQAVYGDLRLAAFQAADVFVMPTLSENFGMTVAEALAAGTPVICTKGAPWAGLEAEDCGWWIDHGAEPMAATLQVAMTLPRSVLKAMGARGRAWMARDFSWDRVAQDMNDVYRWIARGAEAPASVRFD